MPEVDVREQELLRALLESNAAVSGRRVAAVLGISPTTAGKRLKALLDRGLVNAESAGVAVLWSANDANANVRALLAAFAAVFLPEPDLPTTATSILSVPSLGSRTDGGRWQTTSASTSPSVAHGAARRERAKART